MPRASKKPARRQVVKDGVSSIGRRLADVALAVPADAAPALATMQASRDAAVVAAALSATETNAQKQLAVLKDFVTDFPVLIDDETRLAALRVILLVAVEPQALPIQNLRAIHVAIDALAASVPDAFLAMAREIVAAGLARALAGIDADPRANLAPAVTTVQMVLRLPRCAEVCEPAFAELARLLLALVTRCSAEAGVDSEHIPTARAYILLCESVRSLSLVTQELEPLCHAQLATGADAPLACAMRAMIPILRTSTVTRECMTIAGVTYTAMAHRFAAVDSIPSVDALFAEARADGSTVQSRLAIAHGLLASYPVVDLVAVDDGRFYYETLFEFICGECVLPHAAHLRALSFIVLRQWLAKLVGTSDPEAPVLPPQPRARPCLPKLLTLVWTFWDDSVKAVAAQTRDVFSMILAAATRRRDILCVDATGVVQPDDTFLDDLATHLLDTDWYGKGKYGPMAVLAECLTPEELLRLRPNLIRHSLSVLDATSLWSAVANFVAQFIALYRVRVPSQDAWCDLLLPPLMDAILSPEPARRNGALGHVLVAVLDRHTDLFSVLVTRYRDRFSESATMLNFGVALLAAGRSKNLLTSPEQFSDVLSAPVLHAALCHADEAIRKAAWEAMSIVSRPSEPIADFEFDVIERAIPLNLKSGSPAYRQAFVGIIRKLLFRLQSAVATSWRNELRARTDDDRAYDPANLLAESDADPFLLRARCFFERLTTTILDCMYPGVSFARLTLCLDVLYYLVLMSTPDGVNLKSPHRPHQDPRVDAFKQHVFGMPIFSESTVQTLARCLLDSWEQLRRQAFDLLMVSPLAIFTANPQLADTLVSWGAALITSPRQYDCEAGALVMCFLQRKLGLDLSFGRQIGFPERAMVPRPAAADATPLSVPAAEAAFAMQLVDELAREIDCARTSIAKAAQDAPLHGVVKTLRLLIADSTVNNFVLPSKASGDELAAAAQARAAWRPVIRRFLALLHQLPDIVLDLLVSFQHDFAGHERSGDAPLTDADAPETGWQFSSEAARDQMAQTMCWLVVREIGEASQALVRKLPPAPPEYADDAVLVSADYQAVGDMLVDVLARSRHNGVIGRTCEHFSAVCAVLLVSSHTETRAMPGHWLDQILKDALGAERYFMRRSAGIPPAVVAILRAEPARAWCPLFRRTMLYLFDLAKSPLPPDEQDSELERIETSTAFALADQEHVRVHTFNVIKAILGDKLIMEQSAAYVAQAVQVSIGAFGAASWNERNAANMCFKVLCLRLFRTRVQSEGPLRHGVTGAMFFRLYPSLYSFLLDELSEAAASKEIDTEIGGMHPSLFQCLVILSRLVASESEDMATTRPLTVFLPHLRVCAGQKHFRVRYMAARAVTALVTRRNLASFLCGVINDLPSLDDRPVVDHNRVHGLLLQLQQPLLDHLPAMALAPDGRAKIIALVETLIPALRPKLWLISPLMRSATIRTLLLETLRFVFLLPKMDLVRAPAIGALAADLAECGRAIVCDEPRDELVPVSQSELHGVAGALRLVGLCNGAPGAGPAQAEWTARLLASADPHVRTVTLKTLKWLLRDSGEAVDGVALRPVLLARISEEDHPVCLRRTLFLLARIGLVEIPDAIWAHLKTLFKQSERVRVREGVLELAGEAVRLNLASECKDAAMISEWLDMVDECRDEMMPVNIRAAALASLARADLRDAAQDPTATKALFLRTWRAVMALLQDDDDQIRLGASELVACGGLCLESLGSLCEAYAVVERSCDAGDPAVRSELFQMYADQIRGGDGGLDVLAAAQAEAEDAGFELFSVEADNYYADPLTEVQLAARALGRLVATHGQCGSEVLAALEADARREWAVLRDTVQDMPLNRAGGMLGAPGVFDAAYRICSAAAALGVDEITSDAALHGVRGLPRTGAFLVGLGETR